METANITLQDVLTMLEQHPDEIFEVDSACNCPVANVECAEIYENDDDNAIVLRLPEKPTSKYFLFDSDGDAYNLSDEVCEFIEWFDTTFEEKGLANGKTILEAWNAKTTNNH